MKQSVVMRFFLLTTLVNCFNWRSKGFKKSISIIVLKISSVACLSLYRFKYYLVSSCKDVSPESRFIYIALVIYMYLFYGKANWWSKTFDFKVAKVEFGFCVWGPEKQSQKDVGMLCMCVCVCIYLYKSIPKMITLFGLLKASVCVWNIIHYKQISLLF